MVESKIGFSFHPCVSEDCQWPQIHPSSLDQSETSFLEAVTLDLGGSRQYQSRVYSSVDLLSEESLEWCGIGAELEDRKKELGFELEKPNLDWTIHPGGTFSIHRGLCTSSA